MWVQYDPSVAPPEPEELASVFAERLKTAPDVLRHVTLGAEGIYEDEAPAAPVASEPWLRLVVRLPHITGGLSMSPILFTHVPVEVVAQASEAEVPGWEPKTSLRAVHLGCYRRLVGWEPALQYGAPHLQVHRPNAPRAAERVQDALQRVAVYRLLLKPNHPSYG